MLDQLRPPPVAEARRKPLRQPDPLRRLSIRYVDGTLATSARSAASGSSAPTSDVMAPPAKLATTSRPETTPNPHRSALHSVGIGEFLQLAEDLCCKGTFADSEPRCTYPRKKCGVVGSHWGTSQLPTAAIRFFGDSKGRSYPGMCLKRGNLRLECCANVGTYPSVWECRRRSVPKASRTIYVPPSPGKGSADDMKRECFSDERM